jgi:mannose-6-phosphate isomerase-like protein (cupin superfamily)
MDAGMTYTIKNLKEVEDSAVKFGLSETQEARFAMKGLDAEQTGLAHLVVKPGKALAFAHKHEKAEEIYVVLAGTGRVKLDDEIVEVAPLDAIRVAPPVARSFEADDSGLELIVFGPHHEGDGELIQDFWN